MTKRILLSVLCAIGLYGNANGQGMAVNTTGSAANSSAMLDVSSTTKGVLIPRMLKSERDLISGPVQGLMIFQTDNTPGFYYYTGSAWAAVAGAGGATGSAGGDLSGNFPNPSIANDAVTSSKIVNGTILNADINASAAIDYSKLSVPDAAIPVAKLNVGGTAAATKYLDGSGNWSTPAGGGGGGGTATLILEATNTASSTLPTGGTGVAPGIINFNNNVTAATVGTFTPATATYKVAAGQGGLYMINITVASTASTGTAGISPIIYVNGSLHSYGSFIQNTNLPAPAGRGTLTAIVNLAAADEVQIKGSNGNNSTGAVLTTDGSTRLVIMKM